MESNAIVAQYLCKMTPIFGFDQRLLQTRFDRVRTD